MKDKVNTDIGDLHSAEDNQELDKAWSESVKPVANTELITKLEELEAKYQELDDSYKRLWADQQNIVKRNQKEKQDLLKYAAFATLEAILPALDNFEFAKKSINGNTSVEDCVKSIDMLQEQILMSLKSVGLSEIEVNKGFDPELHEAVSKMPDPAKEEGTIVEVLKKGYRLNDRVLRVATVVVSTKE